MAEWLNRPTHNWQIRSSIPTGCTPMGPYLWMLNFDLTTKPDLFAEIQELSRRARARIEKPNTCAQKETRPVARPSGHSNNPVNQQISQIDQLKYKTLN